MSDLAQIIEHHNLPLDWQLLEKRSDGTAWRNRNKGLMVFVSYDIEEDGNWWKHISFSRHNRTPTYEDTLLVRRLFVGKKDYAYQVFPPESEHINLHPYCLHLWVCPGKRCQIFRADEKTERNKRVKN